MKQFQRITQGAAMFVLCAVLLCGNAFADIGDSDGGTFSDVPTGASYAQAVEELAAMGILAGYPDGTFAPNGAVSRAEAATVICRLLGVEDEALAMKNVVFSDVPSTHWAARYIAKAAELGIIGGYGNSKFGPEDQVTYEQMIKMLVCAWGYDELAKTQGGYPDGYLSVAENFGICAGISYFKSSPAPRSSVAVLSYNTLSVPPANFSFEE